MFKPGRNLKAFIESLEKLETLAKSFDVIYACHGSATLGVEWVTKTKAAAQKLLAGKLTGEKPPRDLPCKAYRYDGVTFFYP